jgi:hypothetical protein
MRFESALWQFVVVVGVIGGLAGAGLSKRFEFERSSRLRGCVANQNTIAKAVGVWEANNRPIPSDRELFFELKIDGRIARASPELEALGLHPGSSALLDVVKDPWVFACPARFAHLRDHFGVADFQEVRGKVAETHYRWVGGKTRKATCLLYGAQGQREEPGLEHAPYR